MDAQLLQLQKKTLELQNTCQPAIFRPGNAEHRTALEQIIAGGHVFVHDELHDQLKELLKSRNPGQRPTPENIALWIEQHLAGRNLDEYGVWVYYPWSLRLVHILDEEEFIELRTSANRNKITTAERNALAGKKVGVIGLSVGQSVSLTLALERSCGELRLADFDTLELNNLNRIRTGLHNLGLLKAHIVAREIAEIDPYFKVVCFTHGVNDDNIDDFFLDGGKLDAVIDECDSVNIKILCRIKARELHVPVLMEASDRGTLDVERFDLDPQRPIIHGWLDHLSLDFEVLKNLKTNEEKLPYMLPIAGLDTLSARMKASMIELGVTISTWPQLATAVTLGGAVTADTCRRIFLNQFTDSGRYFVDMEQIVPDTRPQTNYTPAPTGSSLTLSTMQHLATLAGQHAEGIPYAPAEDIIKILVTAAGKAPSAANVQPWHWHYHNSRLFLFHNDDGLVSYSDYNNMYSYPALGAAIENMELAAHKIGLLAHTTLFPVAGEGRLVAAIQFSQGKTATLYRPDVLAASINNRATNRNTGSKVAINEVEQNDLLSAVRSIPGAELIIKSSAEDLAAFANIAGPAERIKLLNPATHFDFFQNELQWADGSSTGSTAAALNLSPPEMMAYKMIKTPDVAQKIAGWQGGSALEYTVRKSVATASAVGLITMPSLTAPDYLYGGRAMERLWLAATAGNISLFPVMSPLLFINRLRNGDIDQLTDAMKEELMKIKQRYQNLFAEANDSTAIFLFILSKGAKPPAPTNRKPINEILSFS